MKNRIATVLVSVTVFLALLGHVMIYSASSYSSGLRGDEFYYVKKQFAGFLLGLVMLVAMRYVSTEKLKRLSLPLLVISCVLLALVFVPGLGVESYGAKRWINLGITTFQPSEIAKFALVIFLASYASKKRLDKWKNLIVPLLAGGVVCVLIMAEPNMSVTVCVGFTLFIMLIMSGIRRGQVACLIVPALILGVVLIVSEPYRYQRLMAFLDPWANPKGEGYQLIQSYYAIASGGFFGVGLFNSRQKYLFLPFAESDFIFSVIAEEMGFFGCLIVVALFLTLVGVGVYASVSAKTTFDSLLAGGISAVIGLQTLINVAVVSGSIPPTGIPLPFISAGGSSLAVFMGAVGILLNILLKKEDDGTKTARIP